MVRMMERSTDAGDEPQQEVGPAAEREHRTRTAGHTQIVLLRHGDPDWSPDGLAVQDPGLTEFGRQQARAAAARLAELPIDAIYVSPYRRSQETAGFLAEATGHELQTVEDLAEIGIKLSGVDQAEVDRFFVSASQRPLQEHWEGWPNSEPFRDFHTRVVRGLQTLLARHGISSRKADDFTVWSCPQPGPTIVVVAHGGTNAVLLTHLLDIRPVPWEWIRFESELCAYSVAQARPLGADGQVFALINFNELDHLRGAGLR